MHTRTLLCLCLLVLCISSSFATKSPLKSINVSKLKLKTGTKFQTDLAPAFVNNMPNGGEIRDQSNKKTAIE